MKEKGGLYMRYISYRLMLFAVLVCTVLTACTACAASDSADRGIVTDTVALPETEAAPATEPPSETEPPLETELPSETTVMTEETTTLLTPMETEAAQTAPATVRTPKLRGMPLSEVTALLEEAGIAYTVTEAYSRKEAAGNILSLRFFGTVEEDHYEIKPDREVSLVVSLGYRPIVNLVSADEKRVYLTFDDGPCKGTDEILPILEQYGVRATFFTLGMYAAVYPERTKAIADAGHCLACHSYSHDYMTLYESTDSVLSEIESWKRAVEKATGDVPENIIFRFPGGSTTYYMDEDRFYDVFWTLTDAGVRVFDWSFANNDRYPGGKREEQSMEDYLKEATVASLDNAEAAPAWPKIMLLHETSDETVAVLPWIIEYLQGEGYSFGTLDELDGYWLLARE